MHAGVHACAPLLAAGGPGVLFADGVGGRGVHAPAQPSRRPRRQVPPHGPADPQQGAHLTVCVCGGGGRGEERGPKAATAKVQPKARMSGRAHSSFAVVAASQKRVLVCGAWPCACTRAGLLWMELRAGAADPALLRRRVRLRAHVHGAPAGVAAGGARQIKKPSGHESMARPWARLQSL